MGTFYLKEECNLESENVFVMEFKCSDEITSC